jgi:GT2 family glycosyltransferase
MIENNTVTVIVVAFNNREWLLKCLFSLVKQSYKALEIVVVDNAPKKQTGLWLKKYFPQVKLKENKKNVGFGAGVNAGARLARGKYLLLANEDMLFESDYIEKLVAVMEKDNSVGVCMGTIYQYDKGQNSRLKVQNSREVQSNGLFFNLSGILTGEKKQGTTSSGKLIEIFSAVVPLMIKRSVFEKVDGFDADFFLYFEEVDLCWRIWLSGKRVVFAPGAKSWHVGGLSARKLKPEIILKHSVRNRIESYCKNLGAWRLFLAIAIQLALTAGGWALFLFRGENRQSWALCQAWCEVGQRLGKIGKKRAVIQAARVISDRELLARVGAGLPWEKIKLLVGI